MPKKDKPLKISKEDLLLIERRIRREEWVESLAYDGRLSPKVFKDRKKEKSRKRCREKIRWND